MLDYSTNQAPAPAVASSFGAQLTCIVFHRGQAKNILPNQTQVQGLAVTKRRTVWALFRTLPQNL